MTSSPRPNKQGAVLVFGESVNDSQSITHLLIGANASLANWVRSLRRPVSLTRDAKPNAVRDWVDELRRTVQAFEAVNGRVAAVVVHRDADGHDPDGAVAADLARQLTTLDGHPVVPVQAIEAWWFLFPEAVEAVRPRAWKDSLPRQPRDVELIDQPKKALQQATRGRRALEYAENMGSMAELTVMIRLIAARSGSLFKLADVAGGARLPHSTARNHLGLLRAVFLVVDVLAWTTSLTTRIVRAAAMQKPRRYAAWQGSFRGLQG